MTGRSETGATSPRFEVCVFLGSSRGARPEYARLAAETGAEIGRRGWGLVYGGAQVGLMGVLADSVLRSGAHVSGVIPEGLARKEVMHHGLPHLEVVGSMHERKRRMAELADAFVALPGGMGTLEELLEMLTWGQLGIHAKPCGVVNAGSYYDPLLALLDQATAEGFVRREHRRMVLSEPTPAALLDRLARYEAPDLSKWLDVEET